MEARRILTIQDVSCLGQCSLTAALPVLSACGFETCILPTALLSTHTGGFQNPAIFQLADKMPQIREHWLSQGFIFDVIYTGYLGSVEAVRETEKIINSLLSPGGLVVVDPAMGDNGSLYSGFDTAYAMAMQKLCTRADIIIPNITEAAIFTGLPYREEMDEGYINDLLAGLHHSCVVLTGVGSRPNETGTAIWDHGIRSDYRHRKYYRMCHGAGDVFASCFLGAYLRGRTLTDSARIAADVVCRSIENTEEGHWYGIRFETVIPDLIAQL